MQILLADDHQLVRDALAGLLRHEPDILVEVASDFAEAIGLVRRGLRFDVILLDWIMPGMNGLQGLAAMRAACPGTPVAILSGTAPRSLAEAALADGAAGFLPKTLSTRALIAAIRVIAAGEMYAPLNLFAEPEPPTVWLAGAQLSERETEVLRHLCEGLSNKDIARRIDLQEVTVKLHVKTLYRKINARNRTQAAMLAKEAGLF